MQTKRRPARTIELPVELGGQVIGVVRYVRGEGYAAIVNGVEIPAHSRDAADLLVIEATRPARLAA